MTTIRTRSESKPRTVQCIECGNNFETTHSQRKYCSSPCRQIGLQRSWNKYGDANRAKRREYHRLHYKDIKVERKAQIKQYRETPKGKKVVRNAGFTQRKNHPEKYRARMGVLMAKRKGLITPLPCYICGNLTTEAHHVDYNKPLNVVWLCTLHHNELHKMIRNDNKHYKNGEITQ